MSITFYPHEEDLASSTLKEKLEVLLSSAERFKSVVLDAAHKLPEEKLAPKDLGYAFQWQEIASVLRQIRELPENNQATRVTKKEFLVKLSEIYEVLRDAKMPKLEAVRLALVNEASHLR